jgi:hypothetical protein
VNVTSSTALGVEISPRLVASKGSGVAALAAAVAGLAYSVSFVILQDSLLASLFLMLGGVLAVPVLVGLAARLGQPLPVSALVAIVLALAAALGSAVHGGFDLANQLHPPATLPPDLPNPVDPRGLLSFGVAGLALVILGVCGDSQRPHPSLARLYRGCRRGAPRRALSRAADHS